MSQRKSKAASKSSAPAPEPLGDEAEPVSRTYDLSQPPQHLRFIVEVTDDDELRRAIGNHFVTILQSHGLDGYTPLILYDEEDPISSWHANRIYRAASAAEKGKDTLLIIHSSGGSIEPAYLISKTCKRLSRDRFIVAIPRRAKSAATLISLGADEIHMGLMSELGPIDPQIGGYPALSLSNALNVLADLACQYPGSSTMFAQYLTSNLDLKDLGYFKRVGESAAQYGERLIGGRSLPGNLTAKSLAAHFVDHYKEHGFVIDVDEARELLGETIKQDTPEYKAANEIYEFLDRTNQWLGVVHDRTLDYVGDVASGFVARAKRKAT